MFCTPTCGFLVLGFCFVCWGIIIIRGGNNNNWDAPKTVYFRDKNSSNHKITESTPWDWSLINCLHCDCGESLWNCTWTIFFELILAIYSRALVAISHKSNFSETLLQVLFTHGPGHVCFRLLLSRKCFEDSVNSLFLRCILALEPTL